MNPAYLVASAAIKAAMKQAADGELKGILEYCDEPWSQLISTATRILRCSTPH